MKCFYCRGEIVQGGTNSNNTKKKFCSEKCGDRYAHQIRDYGEIRGKILDRFNNKCFLCGAIGNLHIHHKDDFGRSVKKPNNDPNNIVVVCSACHKNLHSKHRYKKENLDRVKELWHLSNRAIGRELGICHHTVKSIKDLIIESEYDQAGRVTKVTSREK